MSNSTYKISKWMNNCGYVTCLGKTNNSHWLHHHTFQEVFIPLYCLPTTWYEMTAIFSVKKTYICIMISRQIAEWINKCQVLGISLLDLCSQDDTYAQRVQVEVAFASAAQSPHLTPFVSDRLTQGCVCVSSCAKGMRQRCWSMNWSSVTHLLTMTSFTERLTGTLP